MPRLSPRGSAVMGVGDTRVSVDRVVITPRAGAFGWVDPDRVLLNACDGAAWTLQAVSATTGFVRDLAAGGANQGAAGGGRWAAWRPDRGVWASWGARWPAAGLAGVGTDGRGNMGADGTLALLVGSDAAGWMTVLVSPDGAERRLPIVRSIHVLSRAAAVWVDISGRLGSFGFDSAPLEHPDPVSAVRVVETQIGPVLLLTAGERLILRLWNTLHGRVVVPTPTAFHADAVALSPQLIRVASSRTTGERPEDLEVHDIRVEELVDDLGEPAPVPISRPLWVGCFVGGPSSVPAWRTDTPPNSLPGSCYLLVDDLILRSKTGEEIAQYVAAEGEGQSIETEVEAARRRRPTLPVLAYWVRADQAGRVPPGEYVGVEAYRFRDESLTAFESRVWVAADRCRAPFLIAQGFTSNAALTSDLASLLPVYRRLLPRLPRCRGVLVFSGSGRRSGLQEHPEVLALWAALAASVPGTPPIERLPAPTTPPTPTLPPRPPAPKPPADPIPSAIPYEVSMETERVGLLGPDGKFTRIDPASRGRGLFRGCEVVFDRELAGSQETFELTQPDDKFQLRAIEADVILGADATQFGADLCRQFYTSGGDVTARGGYESWTIVRLPSGIVIAMIEYDREGKRYTSAPLTVVAL